MITSDLKYYKEMLVVLDRIGKDCPNDKEIERAIGVLRVMYSILSEEDNKYTVTMRR